MDFEELYTKWYSRMKSFAAEYVMSNSEAEDIIQDVFMNIYEQRSQLQNHPNIIALLFLSVKNKCIDYLRNQIIQQQTFKKLKSEEELETQMKFDSLEALNPDFNNEVDLEQQIHQAIEQLPERCRQIFIMNKFQGIKQQKIAEQLGISVNTVESQMTIAYIKLKEQLRHNFPLLLIILFQYKH